MKHTIHLNQFLGNHDGSFGVDDSNFLASARNVRLSHALLGAELRTSKGGWVSAQIQLDTIIRIEGSSGFKKKPSVNY